MSLLNNNKRNQNGSGLITILLSTAILLLIAFYYLKSKKTVPAMSTTGSTQIEVYKVPKHVETEVKKLENLEQKKLDETLKQSE